MKSLFFTILIWLSIFASYGQTFPVTNPNGTITITTPNGTSITCTTYDEFTPAYIDSLTAKYQDDFPEATVLASATMSYNCHGYAWSMREGKPACWLEESKLHYYLDDHSFVQTSTVDSAELILYEGLHSAVKSLVEPGKYESKWGIGPLMRHPPEEGPSFTYNNSRTYYRRNVSPTISGPSSTYKGINETFIVNHPPLSDYTWSYSSNLSAGTISAHSRQFTAIGTGSARVSIKVNGTEVAIKNFTVQAPTITGPSSLCTYSSGTFTVSNAPSGYTWTCSSNLTPSTISGNSRIFQAYSASTSSWVAINLNSVELARFNFVVANGPGIVIAIPQARTAAVNVPVTVTPSVTGVTNYRWAISPATPNAHLDNTYGPYAVVTFSATGPYALYGYGIYPCGELSSATVLYTFTVSSSASYSMSAYPNPVSSVLNVDLVELEAASGAFSTAGSQVSGSGGISRARPVYTISLYSVMGALALQTVTNDPGNIQLNVSSLPSGIYTLRVHDGTDSPPLTQHIVISH